MAGVSWATFRTHGGSEVAKREEAATLVHMEAIIADVRAMFANKGEDYNNLTTFAENMPFGDKSWGTLLWIKAHRACSLIHAEKHKFDSLEDVVLDIIVYALSFLAHRRMREAELSEQAAKE